MIPYSRPKRSDLQTLSQSKLLENHTLHSGTYPYSPYMAVPHYLYGYVPPKGVVILKLLIQNGVSISEAFSRTGYNISNARKLHFCKQPFESIQGQIAFKNMVQCVNKQTVVLLLHPRTEYKKLAHFQNGVSVLGRILERSIKNWPISRTGYQFQGKFFPERGANLESQAAHTHPKNTQVPPPPGQQPASQTLFNLSQ